MRTLVLPMLVIVFLVIKALRAPPKVLDFCRGGLFLYRFLIYPSTSAAIFATFQCETLDDGKEMLRADLSIDCQSPEHHLYTWYASAMALIYPFGTPLLYAYLTFYAHGTRLGSMKLNEILRLSNG